MRRPLIPAADALAAVRFGIFLLVALPLGALAFFYLTYYVGYKVYHALNPLPYGKAR